MDNHSPTLRKALKKMIKDAGVGPDLKTLYFLWPPLARAVETAADISSTPEQMVRGLRAGVANSGKVAEQETLEHLPERRCRAFIDGLATSFPDTPNTAKMLVEKANL